MYEAPAELFVHHIGYEVEKAGFIRQAKPGTHDLVGKATILAFGWETSYPLPHNRLTLFSFSPFGFFPSSSLSSCTRCCNAAVGPSLSSVFVLVRKWLFWVVLVFVGLVCFCFVFFGSTLRRWIFHLTGRPGVKLEAFGGRSGSLSSVIAARWWQGSLKDLPILPPFEACGFFNTKMKDETTIYKLQCSGV